MEREPRCLETGPLSSKKQEAVDVPATNENDQFPMDSYNAGPLHVEVQRLTDSALQIFEETTLKRFLGAMVESKVVSLLRKAIQEAAKGEKTPIYQAMGKAVRRAVDWSHQ